MTIILKMILHHKLFYTFCLLITMLSAEAAHPYKIGVVHSYEKNYPDAERYRHILEKELKDNGIESEIQELYLNCDELVYNKELERASSFIDDFAQWGADVIVIFNNQATYSLLKCNNPKLRNIPVIFSGVYHPDEDLIRQYPNVTGYVDIPDYSKTVRMIERIMGKSRIVVMSGTSTVDSQMWDNLKTECVRTGIHTYEGDVFEHILAHRAVKEAKEEDEAEFYNERIDTTVVMRLMSEAMPLRTIQQTARGSETYLMLTARTYNTLDAPSFFANPSFAVINEGFGMNDKMLGGYFTPLETQLKDVAKSIAMRLQGKMPEQQITQSHKEYVLNWKVMQQYGISAENLPSEYHVMYIPLMVRYRYYIISGYILGGLLIFSIFVYLVYSLICERKRKKEAQHKLQYQHEILNLAMEGGTTYAWRQEGSDLSFDLHFYKLINHAGEFITLDQLLVFVYPDDRERFCTSYLKNGTGKTYRGEYRCNFSGEYQWWEFRYSIIKNNKNEIVATGILQNIQEIKNHEEELTQARYIAEQAELKQSFLNNISHEIRTPLNAIVGFSNLLISSSDIPEEDRQEYMNIIHTNNEILLNLINDILELSRIQSGAITLNLQEKDLRTLLCSYYQSYILQVKPELEFFQDFPEEDVTIYVDPMRLQQVITNFLTNANKFTDAGYIKLGYRYSAVKNEVRIFVEDSGKGIPANELDMIFSRFYKRDEFAQGTGLGLAICHTIVDKMHGRIEVESEVGKGSRFTIVLSSV